MFLFGVIIKIKSVKKSIIYYLFYFLKNFFLFVLLFFLYLLLEDFFGFGEFFLCLID